MTGGDGLRLVGRAVAARRGQLGMTQQDLADAAGVDLKTVYNLESGARWPIAKTRSAVSAALGWRDDALAAIRAGDAPRESGHEDTPGYGAPRAADVPAAPEDDSDDLDGFLATDPGELDPFLRAVRKRVTEAKKEHGPEPSGEQVFGPGPEADMWEVAVLPEKVRVRMIAIIRMRWARGEPAQQRPA